MPTHDAEAIILRHYAFSEADRIVVLFTREYGKLRAVARGVRKPRSRLSGTLEPLNHVRLNFFQKEGAELCQIRQCEILRSYLGRSPTPLALHAYSYMAEIVNEFVQENYANHRLFRLFLAALDTGYAAGVSPALIRYFEIWTLRLNGLMPHYVYCSHCGRYVKDDGFFAQVEEGQARCASCAGNKGTHVGAATVQVLSRMMELPPLEFVAATFPPNAVEELGRLSQRLLEFHLEKKLRSLGPLHQVLGSE